MLFMYRRVAIRGGNVQVKMVLRVCVRSFWRLVLTLCYACGRIVLNLCLMKLLRWKRSNICASSM